MADPNLLSFEVDVPPDGRIEVSVPLLAGSHVTVYVTDKAVDNFNDLLVAAVGSTDFWDNPYDDEDWNHA